MARWGNGVLAPEEPLGVLAGEAEPGGLFGGLNRLRNRQPGQRPILDMLGNHSSALFRAGTGVLMAPTRKMASQAWSGGLDSGGQVDYARGKDKAAERRRMQQEQALAAVMADLEAQGKLPAGMGTSLAANPELGMRVAANLLEPQEPVETWEPITHNGMPAQRNTRTGKIDMFPANEGNEPPNDVQLYNFDMADRARRGEPPIPFGEWDQGRRRAGATNIRISEGERRNAGLASVARPQLAIVEQVWPSLGNLVDQAADAVPGAGNFLVSEEYQRGRNSVRSIVASYLYSVSGATATDEEIDRQTSLLMPQPGDQPAVIKDKLDAIRERVRAIEMSGGSATTIEDGSAPANEGWQDMGDGVRIREIP